MFELQTEGLEVTNEMLHAVMAKVNLGVTKIVLEPFRVGFASKISNVLMNQTVQASLIKPSEAAKINDKILAYPSTFKDKYCSQHMRAT